MQIKELLSTFHAPNLCMFNTSIHTTTFICLLYQLTSELLMEFFLKIVHKFMGFHFTCERTLCLAMKEGSSSVGREFKTSSPAYEDAKFVVSKLGLLWSSSERYEDCKLLEGVYRLLEEKEASLRELEEAFSVFDEDGDGLMNQRDLFRVMNKLGFEGVKVEECKKMIKVYDEDGDGCISFNEFKCMLECAT